MNRHNTKSCGLLSVTTWLVLSPVIVSADIYKYVDKHGRVYLTDRPNHAGYKLLIKTWKGWVEQSFAPSARDRKRYAPTIAKAAIKYRLPTALLHAVIAAESAYDPNAVSKEGAVGLMQLMPETARRYGVINRKDPVANIHGGSRYLRDLLTLFDNKLVLALAAYNAGENAVIRHGFKIPPYVETRTYIKRVLEYYRQYRQTMNNEEGILPCRRSPCRSDGFGVANHLNASR